MGKKYIIGLLVSMLTCSKVHASGVGTTGGDILSIPSGARAIAMGEAYTAQADDVSSLYWNPAGLAILNQSEASFMYNQSFQDQSYQNASVAVQVENGGIGGSLSYLSFGQIQGVDANSNPTGQIDAYTGVGTLGGGMLLGPLSLGANVKGVEAKLADVTATGVAADLGALWTLQREVYGGTIRFGATVRNMGSGLKFIDQRDPFPTEARVGVAAVQMMDHKLNLSMDYGKQADVQGAIYTGAEYWLVPMLALRVGYTGTGQEGNGLRLGMGLRVKDFSFDYAYGDFGDLGISHRYEISMRFGGIRPRLSPEERQMLKRAKLAMAQGRFDEAVVLLDSLRNMEPTYRPFQHLEKVAMRGSEQQESGTKSAEALLHRSGQQPNDVAVDASELTNLLKYTDDASAAIANKEVSPRMPDTTPTQGAQP